MTVAPDALPALFVERLRRIVPPDRWADCLAAFARERPVAFRVNTLRGTVADVYDELVRQGFAPAPVEWLDGALTVDAAERRRLTECDAVAAGRIYIQGLSSMTAPVVLGAAPGEEVLDLAAAPGGKTLQLAAMMQNEGRIAAVEAIRTRMFRLEANLRRAGVTIAKTYLTDGRTVGRKTPERFDRVLLDAPCSSEARFRSSDPDSWKHWGPRKIRESARKQKGLLRSAFESLKPGGTLLYCTCSFAPEENELVVESLVKQQGDAVQIEPISLPLTNTRSGLVRWEGVDLDPAVARAVRILPDPRMEGFFLCKLTKSGAQRDCPSRPHRRRKRRRYGVSRS